MARVRLVCVALFAVSCFQGFGSEQDQWEFVDERLRYSAWDSFDNDQALLPGTVVCPQRCAWDGPSAGDIEEDWIYDRCFDETLDGPASWIESDECFCLSLDGPGQVTLGLELQECGAAWPEDDPPVSDRVVFQVSDADDLVAWDEPWLERLLLDEGTFEPAGIVTESSFVAPGEELLVVEGAELVLFVQLWDLALDRAVAWRSGDVDVWLEVAEGEAQRLPEIEQGTGWLGLRTGAGARLELGLEAYGQRWGGLDLRAVPPEQLDTLELVVGYYGSGEQPDERQPLYARAVLRDGLGRIVQGAPVVWEQEGPLVVIPGPTDPALGLGPLGGDRALVLDACAPDNERIGPRNATLMVSHQGLADSVELTWTGTEGNLHRLSDEGYTAYCTEPEVHQLGCGCSGAGGSFSRAWLLLGLLGVALGLRRRR